MTEQKSPSLSVILATPGVYATIRKTIQHLLSQTIRHQLEVVIVATSRAHLQLEDEELAPFCSFQVVEMDNAFHRQANAAGIRQAGPHRGACGGSLFP